jgi:hypothetical protein
MSLCFYSFESVFGRFSRDFRLETVVECSSKFANRNQNVWSARSFLGGCRPEVIFLSRFCMLVLKGRGATSCNFLQSFKG